MTDNKSALDELNAMRMRLKAIDGTYDWEDSYKAIEAALSRIEAVETVTEEDFETFMAETLCMMPRSICVEDLGQVPTKAIMQAYPNGLRIAKEK